MSKLPKKSDMKEMEMMEDPKPKKTGLKVLKALSEGMKRINQNDDEIKSEVEGKYCSHCGQPKIEVEIESED